MGEKRDELGPLARQREMVSGRFMELIRSVNAVCGAGGGGGEAVEEEEKRLAKRLVLLPVLVVGVVVVVVVEGELVVVNGTGGRYCSISDEFSVSKNQRKVSVELLIGEKRS